MARLSPAERRLVVEQLSGWLRQVVEGEDNDVDFHIERGMERASADDLESMKIRPNGTATLVVRINGGARETPSAEERAAEPNA